MALLRVEDHERPGAARDGRGVRGDLDVAVDDEHVRPLVDLVVLRRLAGGSAITTDRDSPREECRICGRRGATAIMRRSQESTGYLRSTTIVLTVALTPSATSTTTM